ncbi:hypothetical protein [Paraburkholderia aspalathi]|uniref:hypothetical protein n=1 Tax=Paraburkholderia aspalathi TaxID=1324617 RepID=UPI0038BAC6C5
MDTLQKARAAGFVVLLDGRIGRETYHTVSGSLSSLERFEALCTAHPVQMFSVAGPEQRSGWTGCTEAGSATVKESAP